MARDKSTVGDWAVAINQLHNAYSSSQINKMDLALNELKLKAQERENKAQRDHEFKLLDKKNEIIDQRAASDRLWEKGNEVFHKYTVDESGEHVLDEEATASAIHENNVYKSKGAQHGQATFMKVNAYYGMEDTTPGYLTEEDIVVLDEYMFDNYLHGDSEMDTASDEYLMSMGVLQENETYSSVEGSGGQDINGKTGVDRHTMTKRFNAFKSGLRENKAIYRDATGYGKYADQLMKTNSTLASAMFQTEESKGLKLDLSSIGGNLKSNLAQYGLYEVDEDDDGNPYYRLEDEEWAANSVAFDIISSSNSEGYLKSILKLKTSSPDMYSKWLERLGKEDSNTQTMIKEALEKTHKLVRNEGKQQQMIDDMIVGNNARHMSNVQEQVSTGRANNNMKKVITDFSAQMGLVMQKGTNEGVEALIKEYKDKLSNKAMIAIMRKIKDEQ